MQIDFKDIVIDTNVLVHASNISCNCYALSLKLLEDILNSKSNICVDDGFDLDAGENRSQIGYEYEKLLKKRNGEFPSQFLAKMFASQRIKEVPKNAEQRQKKIIEQKIKNTKDRIFVNVTCNSNEKILASNDNEDFKKQKRNLLKSKLKINIFCSGKFYDKQNGLCKKCSKF